MSDARRVNRAKYARAQEYIRTGAWIVDAEAGEIHSRRTGKPLAARLSKDGYRNYGITLPATATAKWKIIPVKASRVIYESVHGVIPDGLEVDHEDGNRANDSISNLEAVTAAENIQRSYRLLRPPPLVGEQALGARLTEQQVREIRALCEQGLSQRTVAAQFGICRSTVSVVSRGITWSHVI